MRGVLLHHGGVLTNKGSPSPSRMYYLVGTSEGTTQSKVAECVKRLYLGCVFELLGAFEISQICWGVGWGDRRYPYKLSYLA